MSVPRTSVLMGDVAMWPACSRAGKRGAGEEPSSPNSSPGPLKKKNETVPWAELPPMWQKHGASHAEEEDCVDCVGDYTEKCILQNPNYECTLQPVKQPRHSTAKQSNKRNNTKQDQVDAYIDTECTTSLIGPDGIDLSNTHIGGFNERKLEAMPCGTGCDVSSEAPSVSSHNPCCCTSNKDSGRTSQKDHQSSSTCKQQQKHKVSPGSVNTEDSMKYASPGQAASEHNVKGVRRTQELTNKINGMSLGLKKKPRGLDIGPPHNIVSETLGTTSDTVGTDIQAKVVQYTYHTSARSSSRSNPDLASTTDRVRAVTTQYTTPPYNGCRITDKDNVRPENAAIVSNSYEKVLTNMTIADFVPGTTVIRQPRDNALHRAPMKPLQHHGGGVAPSTDVVFNWSASLSAEAGNSLDTYIINDNQIKLKDTYVNDNQIKLKDNRCNSYANINTSQTLRESQREDLHNVVVQKTQTKYDNKTTLQQKEINSSITTESSAKSKAKKNSTSNEKQKRQKKGTIIEAAVSTHSTGLSTDTTKKISDMRIRLEELREVNSGMKGDLQCKVCLETDVQRVFLPCRHLVCCSTCSERIRNCPMCRTGIRGMVIVRRTSTRPRPKFLHQTRTYNDEHDGVKRIQ